MMTVSLSVADVLSERVTLQVESIDRLYLNLYQPRLMHAGGVAQFFRSHQGATFASSALMAPMTRAFQAAVLRSPRRRTCRWCGSRRDSARTT
jgi:hypothetical protein